MYCILNKASLIWGLPCGIVHVVVHWHLRACLEEVVSRVMYDRVRNRKRLFWNYCHFECSRTLWDGNSNENKNTKYFEIAAILNFKQGSSIVENSNENKNTRKDISVGKKYNITLNFSHFWYSWIQFTKKGKNFKIIFPVPYPIICSNPSSILQKERQKLLLLSIFSRAFKFMNGTVKSNSQAGRMLQIYFRRRKLQSYIW